MQNQPSLHLLVRLFVLLESILSVHQWYTYSMVRLGGYYHFEQLLNSVGRALLTLSILDRSWAHSMGVPVREYSAELKHINFSLLI